MRKDNAFSRALVVGSPGVGKSTFARKLRDRCGLPLVYLDMIWHRPDGTNITRGEFDARLDIELARERWIIDGNYLRTLERRLARADVVFFFDLPADICLAGVAARIGRAREDMPWIEYELDPEFADYVRRFPAEQRPQLIELLAKRPACIASSLCRHFPHRKFDGFRKGSRLVSAVASHPSSRASRRDPCACSCR